MVNSDFKVTFFIGGEKYLREQAIAELRHTTLKDLSSKDLDCKVFYGGETGMKDILDYAATIPFLSEKRFVIIRDCDELSEEDISRLVGYIKKPSRFSCMVLEADTDSILKNHPELSRHARIVRFDVLKGAKLVSWIKKECASRGVKIDDKAAELLGELQSASLFALTQEIEKLAAFAADRKSIAAEDIEEIVGKNVIASTFDLAWAIGSRDVQKALALAKDLLFSGKKAYEVTGLLGWHFKRLWRAKLLSGKGKSDTYISNALKVNRFRQEEFLRQMKTFDIGKIRDDIDILLEMDISLKRSKLAPAAAVELGILKLCLG